MRECSANLSEMKVQKKDVSAETEALILWSPDAKGRLIRK